MKIFCVLLILACCVSCRSPKNADEVLINQIQVIGSHNSYKQAIDPKLFQFLKAKDSAAVSGIDYSHIPLKDQLDLGLQNLEIDINVDEKGGRYAHPQGLSWVPGQAPYDTAHVMNEPGFKVFHVADIDFRSNFLTLKEGLTQLKEWSDAHPDHDAIFVTVEPKEDKPERPNLTEPELFTPKIFDELDHDFITYLGKEHIITPDDIKGQYATLEEAVLHNNWPSVKAAKGKFLFILDTQDHKMGMYMAGHPSLKGRILFVNAKPGTPEAAMMIMNDPHDPKIMQLVKKGYIIRTRADSDTKEARENNYSTFDAAKASGAQIITTDYYQKSTHFKSSYVVRFDGEHKYFRLNPVLSSAK